jgi:hypothetical protein
MAAFAVASACLWSSVEGWRCATAFSGSRRIMEKS